MNPFKQFPLALLLPCLCLVLVSCASSEANRNHQPESSEVIRHLVIYQQDGRFAGWPANNGIWNWGDEILVGFVEAEHYSTDGFHTYNRESARNKYARSLDGGLTWSVEDAYERGQTGWAYDNFLEEDKAEEPVALEHPINDFTDPDFVITFLRYSYHHGPSIFYYSNNRGQEWNGPYRFPDLDTHGIGTRTDYIVEGPQELGAWMNAAKPDRMEGRVIYTRTTDGGVNWEIVSWLGPEPEGFEIMPSTVRLSTEELYTVLRAREVNPGRNFLKAYRSVDNGQIWQHVNDPVQDTGHNGAPPSLLQMEDGRLALTYAYRSRYGSRICLRFSADNGQTWSQEIPVRSGDGANGDVGYPQMVQREDGNLVIVYYWNHAALEDGSPYRYIAASIVDPERFKD